MLQAARSALGLYGLRGARLTLLASGHNHVYRVRTPTGERLALRLQSPHRLSDRAAHSQLIWLQAINAETGLVVPEPVALPDGRLYAEVEVPGSAETRRCVLLRWVEGRGMAARRVTPTIARSLGETVARLHHHARGFAPAPDFACPTKDGEWLFGPSSYLGSGAAQAHLDRADYHVLLEAGEEIRRTMAAFGDDRKFFGVIHGDLGLQNWVFYQGDARPVDFDEFGRGHYLFDLAEVLRSVAHWEQYPDLLAALLTGYTRIRPLPQTEEPQFDLFVAANFFALLNHHWSMREADQAAFMEWLPFHVRMIGRFAREG